MLNEEEENKIDLLLKEANEDLDKYGNTARTELMTEEIQWLCNKLKECNEELEAIKEIVNAK